MDVIKKGASIGLIIVRVSKWIMQMINVDRICQRSLEILTQGIAGFQTGPWLKSSQFETVWEKTTSVQIETDCNWFRNKVVQKGKNRNGEFQRRKKPTEIKLSSQNGQSFRWSRLKWFRLWKKNCQPQSWFRLRCVSLKKIIVSLQLVQSEMCQPQNMNVSLKK